MEGRWGNNHLSLNLKQPPTCNGASTKVSNSLSKQTEKRVTKSWARTLFLKQGHCPNIGESNAKCSGNCKYAVAHGIRGPGLEVLLVV